MTYRGEGSENPTIFQHLSARRWLVIVPTVAFGLLGLLFSAFSGPRYESSATLVIQAPGSNPFAGVIAGSIRPERYVADQVAILESDAVARTAIGGVSPNLADPPDLEEFRSSSSVEWTLDSDVVTATYAAATPEDAQALADAWVNAYVDTRLKESARLSTKATATIRDAIGRVDDELSAVDEQMAAEAATGLVVATLQSDYETALSRFVELTAAAATADEEQLPGIRAEQADLLSFLEVVRTVTAGAPEPVEVSKLLAVRDSLLDQRASLVSRLTDLEIEAESVDSTSIVFSAASFGEPGRGSGIQNTAIALVLGVLFGLGLTMVFPAKDLRLKLPDVVGREFGVPLLAEIPDYTALDVAYIVRDAYESKPSLVYRKLVTMLQTRVEESRKGATEPVETHMPPRDQLGRFVSITYSRPYAGRSHAVLSAGPGEGRTEVVANLAAAAARETGKVLVVDADFATAQLTARLTGSRVTSKGLTEVMMDGLDVKDAIVGVDLGDGTRFSLLGQGFTSTPPQDLFRSQAAQAFFNRVIDLFDLVIVDTPPLYLAAYAGTVARLCDEASLLIPDGMSRAELEDVASRLRPLEVPLFGWIWNHKAVHMVWDSISDGSRRIAK